MILGVCKNLGVTPEYALYEMSYANAVMYNKVTPTYEDTKQEKSNDKWDESLDADNPDNFIGDESVIKI